MVKPTILSCACLLMLLASQLNPVDCATAQSIKDQARSYLGSSKWSFNSSYATGRGTNKCNIFVADVFKAEQISVPNRWQFLYSPIGAREWAKQDSGYLKKAKCWQPCGSLRVIGDVIAKEGHVGIVTGEQQTTSASAITNTVVQNTWGFTGSKPTCWRYQFTKKNC